MINVSIDCIGMKYLISIKRKIDYIVIQDKVLLCLCVVFKLIVCKDDDFSAHTATKFINENIEKCTMMYRAATRNGIDFFHQSNCSHFVVVGKNSLWD